MAQSISVSADEGIEKKADPAVGAPGPRAAVPWWAHGLVIVAVMGIAGYVSAGMWGWTYDDAFIIYRYARNFAAGLGMVYNPGEPYLGTSSAGYTLLLAAMRLVAPGIDFLVLGSIVSGVGLAASGVLMWLLGVQARTPLVGALAAGLTVANPLLVQMWGGEMHLLVPLVLGAILLYGQGRGVAVGVLVGLAILTRQDSVVLVPLLGAHYLWTRRRVPWGAILTGGLVLLPWVLYSWAFFGSPLPGTLEAKIAQGQAGWAYFLSGAADWLRDTVVPNPIVQPLLQRVVLGLLLIGAAGLGWAAWRQRPITPWLLVLGWIALFAAGYTALRVAFYGWYAVPLAIGWAILLAWGLSSVAQAVAEVVGWGWRRLRGATSGHEVPRATRLVVMGVVLVVLVVPIAAWVRAFDDNNIATHRVSDLYQRVGEWLAAHGGPATSVGYLEVGEIGYYSEARVIDLLGLVTPGAAAQIPGHDYEWAVLRYAPEYYLANSRFEGTNQGEGILMHLSHEPWFTAAYSPVLTLTDHRKGDPVTHQMVIFRRQPGTSLPPPIRAVLYQWHTQQPLPLLGDTPPDQRPGQTFTMPAPNLSAITLQIGKPDPADTGTLVFHLRRAPGDTADLRRVEIPMVAIPTHANAWLPLRFDPLPDSAGQTYFFTVEIVDALADQRPIYIWSASDDLLPGGSRMEGTQPAPGDLCLRVSVPDE